MRLALVSAHYPPNFVSGGTLVPQRIAQGLTARGHDVRVFAGRLDEDEAPLSTFTEPDADGIPVTWINTTPWTAWNDPMNVDNPDVHAAFESWLADHRPEVVHFHSLQTLGASLVSAAKEAGCRTVITMHDFWWLCARQFLADLEYRPCCVVVSAGTCQCQAGRAHLDARAATLAPHLRNADLVLAPSSVAAQVLRANGVAGDRLAVNENGMPAPVDIRPRSPTGEGDRMVRLRYTGGNDPMKGAAYLCEAVSHTVATTGWELTVHAPLDDLGALTAMVDDPRVRLESPYPPEDLERVMAETDVLILPSMARETHSIMTREALLRGVPVIATDSLGPEQVIDHGVNGLVVSSLDPTSLAGAIDRLVAEPALVRSLSGSSDLAAWTVSDQIDQLESQLTSAAVRPEVPEWSPRSVVFVVGIDGAPLRYRAQFPAEALELAGIDTTVLHYADPAVERAVARADAVVLYRVPATPRILTIADEARAAGTPVAFDVDDLIVDPEIESDVPALRALAHDEAALWREGVMRYRTTLEHCDAYIGSTEPLVERVAEATGLPAHLKQNAYGLEVARRSDDALRLPREPGPVRIGYFSGTKTHDEDLRTVVPALVSVLDAAPHTELWLGGLLPDVEELQEFGDRVRRLPLRPWNELPAVLRQVDVNLAPLADLGLFNQSKSAIKWLEAALVATPTIATATRPFSSAIRDGVDGVLIDDVDQWAPTMTALVADGPERARIGAAARRRALVQWSPHLQAARLVEILRRIHEAPSSPPRTWTDVTLDEPAAAGPVALTPYPAGEAGSRDAVPVSTHHANGFGHKVWWSLRNESPGTVVRRIARRLRG